VRSGGGLFECRSGGQAQVMPISKRITAFNKRFLNPFTLRLAGRGSMGDLEHVGRSSGRRLHTPLMAFRAGPTVTIALTYGPDVQWLRNVRAAGGCRLRLRGEQLTLGAPRSLDPHEGLARIPNPQRLILRRAIRCRDFIELRVLSAEPSRA
jgi:deazaflavin-dependent oxidoreductase (nitroreductase family)